MKPYTMVEQLHTMITHAISVGEPALARALSVAHAEAMEVAGRGAPDLEHGPAVFDKRVGGAVGYMFGVDGMCMNDNADTVATPAQLASWRAQVGKAAPRALRSLADARVLRAQLKQMGDTKPNRILLARAWGFTGAQAERSIRKVRDGVRWPEPDGGTL